MGLGQKFGAEAEDVRGLLRDTQNAARKLGICFHVGSQAMDPEDFEHAIRQAHAIAVDGGVEVTILDVGGGLPVQYPGMEPRPLPEFFERIHQTRLSLPLFREAELWIEPGRALSARFNSIISHVEAVKGQKLHIDNGLYGDLHDPARYAWPLEAVLLRDISDGDGEDLGEFSFYGPSCDGDDFIQGPFQFPKDIKVGDAIWFKTVGAYGPALRSRFNGCHIEVEEYLIE